MTALAKQIELTAPLQSRPFVWFMGFTHCTTFDEAERIFTKRHGYKSPASWCVMPLSRRGR